MKSETRSLSVIRWLFILITIAFCSQAAAIFKNAPHPNAALLFARWAASEEGQKVYAEGGRAPAHPKVKPLDPIKPERLYPLGVDDIKEYPKYERIWKEVFKLR